MTAAAAVDAESLGGVGALATTDMLSVVAVSASSTGVWPVLPVVATVPVGDPCTSAARGSGLSVCSVAVFPVPVTVCGALPGVVCATFIPAPVAIAASLLVVGGTAGVAVPLPDGSPPFSSTEIAFPPEGCVVEAVVGWVVLVEVSFVEVVGTEALFGVAAEGSAFAVFRAVMFFSIGRAACVLIGTFFLERTGVVRMASLVFCSSSFRA